MARLRVGAASRRQRADCSNVVQGKFLFDGNVIADSRFGVAMRSQLVQEQTRFWQAASAPPACGMAGQSRFAMNTSLTARNPARECQLWLKIGCEEVLGVPDGKDVGL